MNKPTEKMLGSFVFTPYEKDENNTTQKILCSVCLIDVKDGSLPTDMKSTSGIYSLYKQLNDEFLDNSNNIHKMSFMDLLEKFKHGELKYINEQFDFISQNQDFYSQTLDNIQTKALFSSEASEPSAAISITNEEYYIFNSYVDTYYKTLNIIKKSVQIYIDFEHFKTTASKYANADAILHNDLSLNNYIANAKYNRVDNLDVEAQLNITPKLDPYIKEYVTMHGWPPDGIFDSELMSKIIVAEETKFL